MTVIEQLSQWYRAQCNNDWEHSYGVVIETLDNPGWWVKIDLHDTILERVHFETIRSGDEDGEGSWIVCEKKGSQFHGMGDPAQLEVIIEHFLAWARRQPDWLAVPDEATLQARGEADLWELLGSSHGQEKCRVEGCGELRVRHSVFCRPHHWVKVLGRPLPAG